MANGLSVVWVLRVANQADIRPSPFTVIVEFGLSPHPAGRIACRADDPAAKAPNAAANVQVDPGLMLPHGLGGCHTFPLPILAREQTNCGVRACRRIESIKG